VTDTAQEDGYTLVTLTHDEWVEQFGPVLDQHGQPRSFDTVGEEYDEMVRRSTEGDLYCWTEVQADGYIVIASGWHLVDRLAYYLTEVPFDPKTIYEVIVRTPQDDDEVLIYWGDENNDPRRKHAVDAIRAAHPENADSELDLESEIVDLIADLLHLVPFNDDIEDYIDRARSHYEAEKGGEE
jgi:hypothetical protein